MSKKISGFILLFIALTLSVSAGAKQPNVIFILADDLGYSGLKCFGTEYLETPNLDGLCAEGMKFTNGLAAACTCQPSRIAILSGQYSPRTGGYRVMDHHRGSEDLIKYKVPKLEGLALENKTINKCFKEAGYTTAMYGKWHAGNYKKNLYPQYQGFDESYVVASHYDMKKSVPEITLPQGMDASEYLTTKAMDFMTKAQAQKKPFFLYMPYYLVHAPLETKKEYIDHFSKKLKGRKFLTRQPERVPLVAAMTKHLDDCVGRLLSKVDDLGIEEDTIIVFTSDNGSYLEDFNGAYRGKKGDTYDGGLRVPYIVKWKGKIAAGTASHQRIIHHDLYPTLLGLAGLAKPQNHPLDGVDLSPLLQGKKDELKQRPLYLYYPKYAQFKEKTKRWGNSWRNVIYDGDYKLIESVEYDKYELYNIKDDIKEANDLSRKQPERLDNMKKKLHAWMKEVGAPKLTLNPEYKLK